MHLLKIFWTRILLILADTLSYLCLAAMLIVLTGLVLLHVPNRQNYEMLDDILQFVQKLEKPATGLLHAILPGLISMEIAPYLLTLLLLAGWITFWFLGTQLTEKIYTLAEQRQSAKASRAEAKESKTIAKETSSIAIMDGAPMDGSRREQLLELYARTKKTLEEQKKNLSFLAIDVVDSTGMKLGEDPALAERDFRQYKKMVESIITVHKGLKTAWTPDGVMICFASVQNAVEAAQSLIHSLDHFNRNVKSIKAEFKVRCGINAGKVLFDEEVPMEEMTDRNIDIAGHMQKYAEANTIYIGSHAIEEGLSQFGFRPAQKQVDGYDVYEWRAEPAGQKPF